MNESARAPPRTAHQRARGTRALLRCWHALHNDSSRVDILLKSIISPDTIVCGNFIDATRCNLSSKSMRRIARAHRYFRSEPWTSFIGSIGHSRSRFLGFGRARLKVQQRLFGNTHWTDANLVTSEVFAFAAILARLCRHQAVQSCAHCVRHPGSMRGSRNSAKLFSAEVEKQD